MKKIIVGTDFSKTSAVALQYAVNIAQKVDASITLVHVLKEKDLESKQPEEKERAGKEIEGAFADLIEKHAEGFQGEIETKIREGRVYQEITNQARYSDAWLIITGAHGLSGFEEIWLGSHAYKIVSHAGCPVLTVRKSFDPEKGISKIVLPIDSTYETTQKLPFAEEMAGLFKAEVHIVSLYSSLTHHTREKVDSNTREAVKHLKNKDIKYITKEMVTENITSSTIEYATEINADLICIMTEQEFAPPNIFLGPYAQQMVNRSPIPVLSIRTKQLIDPSGIIE